MSKQTKDLSPYYDKTAQRPPRDTLVFALDCFDASPAPGRPRFALDLGCGVGRDTIELLRRGWHVLAIDERPDAIEGLLGRADLPTESRARLETRVARFEDTDLPRADLINSGFALPGCSPTCFPALWDRIVTALEPGGRFAGQLYGDRDSWTRSKERRASMTFLSRIEVDRLLVDLVVESLSEREDDAVTPRGKAKHWHVFHLVARKDR